MQYDFRTSRTRCRPELRHTEKGLTAAWEDPLVKAIRPQVAGVDTAPRVDAHLGVVRVLGVLRLGTSAQRVAEGCRLET